jgi:hypothetical protein
LSVRASVIGGSRTRQGVSFLFIIGWLTYPTLVLCQKLTEEDDLKKEIIYDGKRYKVYSNWVSFGGGPALKVTSKSTQFAGDISYSFHLKKEYFQLGVLVSGDRFGENNNIMWHGAYGKRFENTKYCWATWAGLTYASYKPYIDSSATYSRKINTSPGIYIASQFFGKLKYDIGIGPSAFFSYYFDKQYLLGLRIDLLFSGAYKGKKE